MENIKKAYTGTLSNVMDAIIKDYDENSAYVVYGAFKTIEKSGVDEVAISANDSDLESQLTVETDSMGTITIRRV